MTPRLDKKDSSSLSESYKTKVEDENQSKIDIVAERSVKELTDFYETRIREPSSSANSLAEKAISFRKKSIETIKRAPACPIKDISELKNVDFSLNLDLKDKDYTKEKNVAQLEIDNLRNREKSSSDYYFRVYRPLSDEYEQSSKEQFSSFAALSKRNEIQKRDRSDQGEIDGSDGQRKFRKQEGVGKDNSIYGSYSSSKRDMEPLQRSTTQRGQSMRMHYLPMKGEIFLNAIKNGTKLFEGRVNNTTCQKMGVGDQLKLFDSRARWGIICEIVSKDKFPDFPEMLRDKGVLTMLPQLKPLADSMNYDRLLAEGIKIYRAFPGAERVRSFGAVAIGVKYLRDVV